jgi:quinol monooxygenase YgiN
MVLVTMRYRVRDMQRFQAAFEYFQNLDVEEQASPTNHAVRVMREVHDPSMWMVVEQWDSMDENRAAWERWQSTHRQRWLDIAGVDPADVERCEWLDANPRDAR